MPYQRIESRVALAALVDLLRDQVSPALSPAAGDTTRGVYAGRAPADVARDTLGPHPYAVVRCDTGAGHARYCGVEGSVTLTWYVTCVGGTYDRVLAAADRVLAAAAGAVIVVGSQPARLTVPPGYAAGVPRQDPSGSPGSADPPLVLVPLQFQATFAGS